mgnify:CR=1 FL=1
MILLPQSNKKIASTTRAKAIFYHKYLYSILNGSALQGHFVRQFFHQIEQL